MPNYICLDCRSKGKTQELVIDECPCCGGPLAIIADDEFIEQSFVLHGTIDEIKYFLEEKMIHISELQKTNEELTKKLQLETTLPDTYVMCPHAKHCSLNDSCYHSKPHVPIEFESTTCFHQATKCLEYETRCIPINI